MQAISPRPQSDRVARRLGYFFIPPLIGLTLLALILGAAMALYRADHNGRIYTGVTVQGVDVSGLTTAEAAAALRDATAYSTNGKVALSDPATGQSWRFTPAQLGILVDGEATASAAFNVGRSGGPFDRLRDTFQSWYYGRAIAPIVVFDRPNWSAA